MLVHAPECAPCAVVSFYHEGVIHLLFSSPRTVVAGAELSYIHPTLIVGEISQMQALVGCWRIDEYLADGVLALYGVCRGILVYLLLHLLSADSLTGTGSCHEQR